MLCFSLFLLIAFHLHDVFHSFFFLFVVSLILLFFPLFFFFVAPFFHGRRSASYRDSDAYTWDGGEVGRPSAKCDE